MVFTKRDARQYSLSCATALSHGAVIFNDTLRSVTRHNPLLEYDLDGNRTFDIGFITRSGNSAALLVTGPITTPILRTTRPNVGLRVAALQEGETIDSAAGHPTFSYTQFTPGAVFLLSRPLGDDPFPADFPPFLGVDVERQLRLPPDDN